MPDFSLENTFSGQQLLLSEESNISSRIRENTTRLLTVSLFRRLQCSVCVDLQRDELNERITEIEKSEVKCMRTGILSIWRH